MCIVAMEYGAIIIDLPCTLENPAMMVYPHQPLGVEFLKGKTNRFITLLLRKVEGWYNR